MHQTCHKKYSTTSLGNPFILGSKDPWSSYDSQNSAGVDVDDPTSDVAENLGSFFICSVQPKRMVLN